MCCSCILDLLVPITQRRPGIVISHLLLRDCFQLFLACFQQGAFLCVLLCLFKVLRKSVRVAVDMTCVFIHRQVQFGVDSVQFIHSLLELCFLCCGEILYTVQILNLRCQSVSHCGIGFVRPHDFLCSVGLILSFLRIFLTGINQ